MKTVFGLPKFFTTVNEFMTHVYLNVFYTLRTDALKFLNVLMAIWGI
jgi:hypothetical protein